MISAPDVPVSDQVANLERRVERLEAENDRLSDRLDSAEADACDFESKYEWAVDKIDRLESEHDADRRKPYRPDVKRMDAGDWTHASSICVCDACGYQYWEHAHVPGYEWYTGSATEGW
jgi:hypothetical protein